MAPIAHGTCRAWSAYRAWHIYGVAHTGRGTYRAWHIHGGKVSLTYESSYFIYQHIFILRMVGLRMSTNGQLREMVLL